MPLPLAGQDSRGTAGRPLCNPPAGRRSRRPPLGPPPPPAPGWAQAPPQDPDADKPQIRQEETVTVRTTLVPEVNAVATKLPLPNRLTPASVGAVGAPLLEQQDARVLGDALRNVSGLNPQTESGVADYFLL